MFSLVFKLLLTCSLMISSAYASGGGEAKEEVKGEAKADGHGEAAPKKEIKKSEDSYAVVHARVMGLEAKVRSAEEEIRKLIKEKQQTTDEKKLNEIIKQMLTLHHEMEKNAKDYDQQRALLNYRYPEKDLSENRKYERIEIKSIEEMEGQMSLTGSIKKTMGKMRSVYSSSRKSSQREKLDKNRQEKDEMSGAPGLVEPVILKK